MNIDIFKHKNKLAKQYLNGTLDNYLLQKILLVDRESRLQKKIAKHAKSSDTEDKVLKLLVWEFNTIQIKHAGIERSLLKNIAMFICQNRHSFIDIDSYESTLSHLMSVAFDVLSVSDWNKLGFVCNANGLFRLSGICRGKAVELALKRVETDKKIVSLLSAFKAFFDKGDFQQAHILLDQAVSISSADYVQYLKKSFYNYLSPTAEYAYCLDAGGKKYNEMVHGKKVAIVAPGLVDITDAIINEINSFDCIVVFSYKGQKIDKRFNAPNISYYNCGTASMLKDDFDDFVYDLDFVVFKSLDHVYQDELVAQVRAKKREYDLKELFFVHDPNLVQIALDDLLRFNPEKIKVFGSNFYLNEKIYADGYELAPLSDADAMWRACANHNVLSQIHFVRNLYNINVIELDDICLKIINMDDSEILACYEKLYSNIK